MLLLWVGSTEIFIHSCKLRLYLQMEVYAEVCFQGCAEQGLYRAPTGRQTVSMQLKSQGVRVTVRVSAIVAGSCKVGQYLTSRSG